MAAVGNNRISTVYFGDEADVLIAEYIHEICYRAVKSAAADFRTSAEYRRRRVARTRGAALKAFTAGMVGRLARRLVAAKPDPAGRIEAKRARLASILAAKGMEFTAVKRAPAKIPAAFQRAAIAGDGAARGVPLNPGVRDRADRVAGYLPGARR